MTSTSSCAIGIKLESKCHKKYLQPIDWTNKFWCIQWKRKTTTYIKSSDWKNIRYMLSPQTNLSHHTCNFAKRMLRPIQTTQEIT